VSLAARTLALLLTAIAIACSSDGSTAPGGGRLAVDAVAVTPASLPLVLGRQAQLAAVAYDAQGNEVSGRQVFWASGDSSVATVSSSGMVTAKALGSVQVQAVIDGKPAYSFVTVVARPVATVAVAPNPASVGAGATTQLTAALADDQGAALTGRIVTWSSDNEAVALVTSTGLVSGRVPGTAVITATSEGRTGSTTVTVTGTVAPPGPGGAQPVVARVLVQPGTAEVQLKKKVTLTAVVFDAADRVITGRTITWTSRNAGVASVDGSGVVTGESLGSTEIVATVDGKSASAQVTVQKNAANKVEISTPTTTLNVGQQVDFKATVFDDANQQLDDRTVVWKSTPESVVQVVSTAGNSVTLRAVTSGAAVIEAQVQGEGNVRKEASVQVLQPPSTPAPVTRVEVAPNPATMSEGAKLRFTASTFGTGNQLLTGRSCTWASNSTTHATVNAATGEVTALRATKKGPPIPGGQLRITATCEGVSGSAVLVIND
jgi:uncharacterized protein YjdB